MWHVQKKLQMLLKFCSNIVTITYKRCGKKICFSQRASTCAKTSKIASAECLVASASCAIDLSAGRGVSSSVLGLDDKLLRKTHGCTGCAKKFYPLRFSDNFSETAENF